MGSLTVANRQFCDSEAAYTKRRGGGTDALPRIIYARKALMGREVMRTGWRLTSFTEQNLVIEGLTLLGKQPGWRRVYWHTHEDNYRARILYDRLAPRTDYVRYDIDL